MEENANDLSQARRKDWESYWAQRLTDTSGPQHRLVSAMDTILIGQSLPFLRERGLRRLLFAGNGLSRAPYLLMSCGFDVTVVDIAENANAVLRKWTMTPERLARFLPVYRPPRDKRRGNFWTFDKELSLARVAREQRPGGSLEIVTADLFDYEPHVPFDLIYSARCVQCFEETEQDELARHFWNWLRPGGICVIETMNVVHHEGAAERMKTAFLRAGFADAESFDIRSNAEQYVEEAKTDGLIKRWLDQFSRNAKNTSPMLQTARRPRLSREQAAREQQLAHEREKVYMRLDAGEKLILFWHGSG